METKNIMIVGVGGQGSLLASKLLGHLLMEQGYDVKVSEVHGMSQRGGSVVTYVRYGERVNSPIIDQGEADFIVSFELLEGDDEVRLPPVDDRGIDPVPEADVGDDAAAPLAHAVHLGDLDVVALG